MKIGVTAVSGKLGGAIARAVREKIGSESVVGLARTVERAQGLGIEVRPGDYNHIDQLTTSMAGIDVLLLVSGMDAPDKRIQQHRNVIEAAHKNGVQKIVYTSVQGLEEGTGFSPIVESNRQTEADVRDSGLDWAIGRNGIYIEPDVEYIEKYEAAGEVANCAGDAVCGYTTRDELAYAYAELLTDSSLDGDTYNLHGTPLTQYQLVEYLNLAFGTKLVYRPMSVEAYRADRTDALGPFLGGVIAGIYEGIRKGAFDVDADFERVAGRPHQSWDNYFDAVRTPS